MGGDFRLSALSESGNDSQNALMSGGLYLPAQFGLIDDAQNTLRCQLPVYLRGILAA